MVKKHRYWFMSLFFCLIVAVGIFYHRSRSEVSEFKWLIEPKLYRAHDFYKGVAWVQEKHGEPSKLIDKRGNVIIDNFQGEVPSYSSIDNETGLIAFHNKARLWGYTNLSGDVVISPEYHVANTFRDGVAGVQKDDFYGAIDRYGEIVLPLMYEWVWVIDSNTFAVKRDDKWEFVNAKGERVIDLVFEQAGMQPFPGVYSVVLNQKSGLIDKTGQWILPAIYDHFYYPPRFSAELEPIGVAKDGKVGYVDAKGNVVIDFQFKATGKRTLFIYDFSEGRASVILPSGDGEFGVIDRTGKVLFKLPGVPAGWYSEGYLLVSRKDKTYGLVDRDGKWHPLPLDIGPSIVYGRVSDGVLNVIKGTSFGYLEIRKNGR